MKDGCDDSKSGSVILELSKFLCDCFTAPTSRTLSLPRRIVPIMATRCSYFCAIFVRHFMVAINFMVNFINYISRINLNLLLH